MLRFTLCVFAVCLFAGPFAWAQATDADPDQDLIRQAFDLQAFELRAIRMAPGPAGQAKLFYTLRVSQNRRQQLQLTLTQQHIDAEAAESLTKKSADTVRALAIARASGLIATIDGLTTAQQEKLRLAADADANRIVRRIQQWTAEYSSEALAPAARVQRATEDLDKLNATIQRYLYSEQSLVNRVCMTVLSEDQRKELSRNHLRWLCNSVDTATLLGGPKCELLFELLQAHATSVSVVLNRKKYASVTFRSVPAAELLQIMSRNELSAVERLVTYYELVR